MWTLTDSFTHGAAQLARDLALLLRVPLSVLGHQRPDHLLRTDLTLNQCLVQDVHLQQGINLTLMTLSLLLNYLHFYIQDTRKIQHKSNLVHGPAVVGKEVLGFEHLPAFRTHDALALVILHVSTPFEHLSVRNVAPVTAEMRKHKMLSDLFFFFSGET